MTNQDATGEKFTPGPWFGSRKNPVFIPLKAISCERLGFSIGWVNGHREEEAAANARLIATAPELLIESRRLISAIEQQSDADELCARLGGWRGLAIAIAKATEGAE